MTENLKDKEKYWGPFDKLLKGLLGDKYIDNLKDISQGYVGTKLDEFRSENVPNKGPNFDDIRRATSNVQNALQDISSEGKPKTAWGEIFMETIDAILPPYVMLLEKYNGVDSELISWSARQLYLLYDESIKDRTVRKGYLPDLDIIASRLSYRLPPHLLAVARVLGK